MGGTMEAVLIAPSTMRLKGKQVTIVIDPLSDHKKTPVDATLFFSQMPEAFDTSLLEGNKILIDGAGEYEIGGVKVSGNASGKDIFYEIGIDGIELVVAKASSLAKRKDDSKEYQMAVLNADTLVDQSLVAALNLNVLLLYGEHAKETITKLGKEELASVSKYSITREKLPTDTEMVLLQ